MSVREYFKNRLEMEKESLEKAYNDSNYERINKISEEIMHLIRLIAEMEKEGK